MEDRRNQIDQEDFTEGPELHLINLINHEVEELVAQEDIQDFEK